MGKKGTWFSAIKRLFTSTSNLNNDNKGRLKLKLKRGSFIPGRFREREPSSIEKILGEVEQQQNILYHVSNSPPTTHIPVSISHPTTHIPVSISPPTTHIPVSISPPTTHIPVSISPPTTHIPVSISPPTTHIPVSISPPTTHIPVSPTRQIQIQIPQTQASYSPTPLQHLSATKIQAAYRGYMVRKRKRRRRSLTSGLVRLQGVVTGQQVKRQTANAMKQMQLLVRIQTQIHSRRIQMNQQPLNKQQLLSQSESDMGDEYSWDDSFITKEEREARLHRKAEAVIKREKAKAYAYSHQLWKATPKSAQNSIQSGWWWSRLERQFPCHVKNRQFASTSRPTTPRLMKKQNNTSLSPMSSRSMVPPRTRQRMKYSHSNSNSNSIKDDDSLMSCPPFSSVPNYMSPTVSAKAKARPTSNPKDRMPSSPGSVSFPPTPNSNSNGSVNWKKGSGSSTRKHQSPGSIGELSMDSHSAVGRKPFNRFV